MAKKKKRKLTARNADKHDLYQQSVQAPDVDAHFLARLYKKANDKPARLFREDFCGTAILSCEFVKRHRKNRAVGVDFHGPTLDWGRKHNISNLSADQQKRIRLIKDNVLNVRSPKADIIAAMNFSYAVFKTRKDLGSYISTAYRSLSEDGLFVMDAWGGAQSQELMEERKRMSGFTYVWDQHDFDPVSHHILCKIHFDFRDGSRMRNAFVYDWRLWTLPEIQELMADAGFEDIHVLWEGTEKKTGTGNGVFRRVTRGGDELAWIAYVVGKK
jgi:SAM-dependent methyltransferase